MEKKRSLLIRTLLIILVIAAIVLAVLFLVKKYIPDLLYILEHGDEGEIEAFIRAGGSFKGVAVTALLQVLQVLSVIFPGIPIQVAAGIIFGALPGFLICHLSYIAANLAVFSVVRSLHGRAREIAKYPRKESRLKFITESEYPAFMVVLSCLMPFLPNGIIPYVAARTRITHRNFTLACAVGSAPTILIFAAIGNRILKGNFVIAAVLFGGMMAGIVLSFIFRDRIIELGRRIASRFRRPSAGATPSDGSADAADCAQTAPDDADKGDC